MKPFENAEPFDDVKPVVIRGSVRGKAAEAALLGLLVAGGAYLFTSRFVKPFTDHLAVLFAFSLIVLIEQLLWSRVYVRWDAEGITVKKGFRSGKQFPWSRVAKYRFEEISGDILILLLDSSDKILVDAVIPCDTWLQHPGKVERLRAVLAQHAQEIDLESVVFGPDKNNLEPPENPILLPYNDNLVSAWISGGVFVVFAAGMLLYFNEPALTWTGLLSLPCFWFALERNIQLETANSGLIVRRPWRVIMIPWFEMQRVTCTRAKIEIEQFGPGSSSSILEIQPVGEPQKFERSRALLKLECERRNIPFKIDFTKEEVIQLFSDK